MQAVEEKRGTKRKASDLKNWGNDMVTLKVIDDEGGTQCMDLNDTTKRAESLLLRYFYKNSLGDSENYLPKPRKLIDIYLLADKLLMPDLQNEAIRGIYDWQVYNNIVQTKDLHKVYAETLPGNPLRRFLCDQIARELKSEAFEEGLDDGFYPDKCLGDVLKAMKRNQWLPYWEQTNILDYLVDIPVVGHEE